MPIRAFTLIELLIVIAIIGILASGVIIAINPARQFAQARNTTRLSDVHAILNAVDNRLIDNYGLFTGQGCPTEIPETATAIASAGYNLRPCVVPVYLPELPVDPASGKNMCRSDACNGSGENYDTGYTIRKDTQTGRVTVCAPGAAESTLPDSQPYCLTR